jgi:tetratricopeptide (TPR) repeat protein
MKRPCLILILLVVLAFGLAARVQPSLTRESDASGNVFQVFFGEGRRMFANHFAVKADVYLHSGLYPSIFDQAAQAGEQEKHTNSTEHVDEPDSHHEANAGHDAHDEHAEGHVHGPECEHGHEEVETGLGGHECDVSFLGTPRDWFEAMGRKFMVTQHTHLSSGKEREILPWLEMAADLDPQREETYVVTSYWLSKEMNQPKEAEAFLRKGLSANPKSYEILFELGRVYQHHLNDSKRARNVWLQALRRWDEIEAQKEEPDKVGRSKILGQLAESYLKNGSYDDAIKYFEEVKINSPAPESVEKRIEEIRRLRSGAAPGPTSGPL